MTSKGLDALADQVYIFLVDHGPTPLPEIQAVFGADAPDAVSVLREDGYVIGEPPAARPPRRAFSPLVHEARRRLETLESHVEALQDRYDANPANTGAPLVERITTREELTRTYNALDKATKLEWMQLYTAPFVPLPPFTPPPPGHNPNSLPVRRMVYERDCLANPGALASIRNAARWGVRIRIATEVSNRLVISDRKVAMSPEAPPAHLPFVKTSSPVLVAALVAQFEAEWQAAVPLEGDPDRLTSIPSDLDGDDLVALQLILQGEKYSMIARTMKCSPKTVQRRVDRMCQLAGVKGRSQLVHYATLHWLTEMKHA